MSHTQKSEEPNTRRTFLKSAAGAGAGVATINAIAPAKVLGANERIRMGFIGVGGRGQWGLRECKMRDARIVAVCDVYEARLMRAREMSEENGNKADAYYEHERVLERNDIDAVFIATPDHWHHDQLIEAVRAGKDAYIEKPLSKSIEEGQNMVSETRKTDRIVQVGNLRRSGKHWERAREVIRSGVLDRKSVV